MTQGLYSWAFILAKYGRSVETLGCKVPSQNQDRIAVLRQQRKIDRAKGATLQVLQVLSKPHCPSQLNLCVQHQHRFSLDIDLLTEQFSFFLKKQKSLMLWQEDGEGGQSILFPFNLALDSQETTFNLRKDHRFNPSPQGTQYYFWQPGIYSESSGRYRCSLFIFQVAFWSVLRSFHLEFSPSFIFTFLACRLSDLLSTPVQYEWSYCSEWRRIAFHGKSLIILLC